MHDYDVITRRAVFRNADTRPRAVNSFSNNTSRNSNSSGSGNSDSAAANSTSSVASPTPYCATMQYHHLGNSKVVQKASSMSLDFEAAANPFHMVQLSGR